MNTVPLAAASTVEASTVAALVCLAVSGVCLAAGLRLFVRAVRADNRRKLQMIDGLRRKPVAFLRSRYPRHKAGGFVQAELLRGLVECAVIVALLLALAFFMLGVDA